MHDRWPVEIVNSRSLALTTLPGAVGLSMGKCEQDRVVVIHTGDSNSGPDL